MVTVNDLKFIQVTDKNDTPYFTCCNCGKQTRISLGAWYADYRISPDAVFTFILCDAECVVSFYEISKRSIVNKYINDRINSAIKMHNQ